MQEAGYGVVHSQEPPASAIQGSIQREALEIPDTRAEGNRSPGSSHANGEADVAELENSAPERLSPDEALSIAVNEETAEEKQASAIQLAMPEAAVVAHVPSGGETEATSATEWINPPDALWRALSSQRLGLAAALIEVGAPNLEASLLAATIRLAGMALVADGGGEVDDRAREATRQALDAVQGGGTGADVTLAALSLLLPASTTLALLAPGSDQTGLLAAILIGPGDEGLVAKHIPALYDLARTMAQSPVAGAAFVSAPRDYGETGNRGGLAEGIETDCRGDCGVAQRTVCPEQSLRSSHRRLARDAAAFRAARRCAASGDAGKYNSG